MHPATLRTLTAHLQQGRLEDAMACLGKIRSAAGQELASAMIAHAFGRRDINAAWRTVAASTLSAHLKQLLFNELWTG